MSSDQIEVTLNLLTFLEADEGWIFAREGGTPTVDEILKFLCPPMHDDHKAILERYRELIGERRNQLPILPAERRILQKMFLPLRAAIGSYMVANYLGTIALCGSVCEMLAIFWYDLARVKTRDVIMDTAAQRKMYGNSLKN